jgi:formylglycine-generating enzyme required for sulfatase activity
MVDAFISYRRKPSASLAQVIRDKLKYQHNLDAYLDTTRTDSTHVTFPERLMAAIETSPCFICVLGETTLESEWVLKEIQRAYDLKKFCIPVFQESYIPSSTTSPAVDYLLDHDGVHIFDIKNVMMDESVGKIAALIPKSSQQGFPLTRVLIGLIALVVIGVAGFALSQGDKTPQPTIPTEIATTIVAVIDSVTPTLSNGQLLETAQYQSTETAIIKTLEAMTRVLSITPTTPSSTQTLTPSATPTNTIAPTITPMPTDPPTPNRTATLDARARAGVVSNRDWTPIERTFGGIPMMLVPTGCFTMGGDASNITGDMANNYPAHHQCNNRVFWIDKTAVTQGQANPGSGTNNYPLVNITWFGARDYCAARGGRLPTELEWEFAARGPDRLTYPWGYEFNSANVVYNANANNQPEEVGSKPSGVSWVGALDLSGNVRTWVSSLIAPYPYNATDGREDLNAAGARVIRGGSWGNNEYFAISYVRTNVVPKQDVGYADVGVRCVRDFVSGE